MHTDRAAIAGVAAVSAALLMTELALTRVFSVTMCYHFAFLAISIALFGLSASGVAVYVRRRRFASIDTAVLLATVAMAHAFGTLGRPVDTPHPDRIRGDLVVPAGFLLGMPMPGGMRLIAADRADIIPWGWGVNGAFRCPRHARRVSRNDLGSL